MSEVKNESVHNDTLPEKLRGKVIVANGAVYYSNEIPADDHELRAVISYARRKGIEEINALPTTEFAKFYNENSKAVSESEVQEMGKNLIQRAHEAGASDIHIADHGSFSTVRTRNLGMMEDSGTLPAKVGEDLIRTIYNTMTQGAASSFSETERQDGRMKREFLPKEVHSVRVHTEPIQSLMASGDKGTFMALRLLYDITGVTGTLEERFAALGYTPEHISIFRYLSNRSGMTLFSGPTGSGKTTAYKHYLESGADTYRDKAYMSIESPPEYPMERVVQVHVDGNDALGWKRAIKGAMRSDPDVIGVGEILDGETALAALDAAQTGHSILTSMHASSALDIITRLAGLLNESGKNNPRDLICDHSVCSGLVHQRLVPILCPECKIPLTEYRDMDKENSLRRAHMPEPVLKRLLKAVDIKNCMEAIHVRGEGCSHCNGKGFLNRTVVAEVIATDHVLLSHLRKHDFSKAHKHWIEEQGGKSFVQHAIQLIEEGKLDPFETEKKLGLPLNYDKVSSNYRLSASDISEISGQGS